MSFCLGFRVYGGGPKGVKGSCQVRVWGLGFRHRVKVWGLAWG